MSKAYLSITLFIGLLIFSFCSNDYNEQVRIENVVTNDLGDAIVLVNECSNNLYRSKLMENKNLDSNSFVLSIEFKDGTKTKTHTLNIRPSMSKISYCTEDYVVVGFSCGGPCYSSVFVFTKQDRANEQFNYTQRVALDNNIITHIKDEDFENLIVHNFKNGKELKIDLSDLQWVNHGQMDTMYIVGNELVVEYLTKNNVFKNKTVNLESILE